MEIMFLRYGILGRYFRTWSHIMLCTKRFV